MCPHCGYHRQLPSPQRVELLTDAGSFEEIDSNLVSVDILKFEGVVSYADKLVQNISKTGMNDAIVCGIAKLNGIEYALGVMDFRFLGASMGVCSRRKSCQAY